MATTKRPPRANAPAMFSTFGEWTIQLVALAPRLKGPIQLAGFLFAVLAAALIRFVNPDNPQALAQVAAFGVAIVVVALLLHPELLKVFPVTARAVVVLVTIAMLLGSFIALTVVTVKNIDIPAKGPRFDTKLDPKNVRVIGRLPDGKYRVEIIWDLIALSKSEEESASIFTGLAVLHDDNQVKVDGVGQPTTRSCTETPSCVGYRVFREYSSSPILVRGGSSGSTLTTVVDIARLPDRLRVWWQFYQREGERSGYRCKVDNDVVGVVEGIPPLALYDGRDNKIRANCYMSYGQRVIPL